MRETAPVLAQKFEHAAVLYDGTDEYLDAVLGFVGAGLERADPVLVAVPGPKGGLLREHLGGQAGRVSFADMTDLGANPAWIIPRVAAELCETTRHEALVNLAFAGTSASILCPYDRRRLPPGVIADAAHTHPVLITGGRSQPSRAYPEPGVFPAGCDRPLPRPPRRACAAAKARRAGLTAMTRSQVRPAVSLARRACRAAKARTAARSSR